MWIKHVGGFDILIPFCRATSSTLSCLQFSQSILGNEVYGPMQDPTAMPSCEISATNIMQKIHGKTHHISVPAVGKFKRNCIPSSQNHDFLHTSWCGWWYVQFLWVHVGIPLTSIHVLQNFAIAFFHDPSGLFTSTNIMMSNSLTSLFSTGHSNQKSE